MAWEVASKSLPPVSGPGSEWAGDASEQYTSCLAWAAPAARAAMAVAAKSAFINFMLAVSRRYFRARLATRASAPTKLITQRSEMGEFVHVVNLMTGG